MTLRQILTGLAALTAAATIAADVHSVWAYPGTSGKMEYKSTERGDRMADFSHAGYMGGGVPLPTVPAVIKVNHECCRHDYTDVIQRAIDSVSKRPLRNGFRGAVLLAPGEFPCSTSVVIKADGVVLRGSGVEGAQASTIKMTGKNRYSAIVVNRLGTDKGSSEETTGKRIKVTDSYIPAGSRTVTLASTSGIRPGDYLSISKPVTQKWLEFMQMHNLVRDGKPQTWIKVGTRLRARREVESVNGNKVTFKVPLIDSYDPAYCNNDIQVEKFKRIDYVRQSGVENLCISAPNQAVNHTEALFFGLRITGEDCWARNVNLYETMESVGVGGHRITLQNVNVIRRALHQGSSKPAEFAPNGGQVLMDRCSVDGYNVWFVAVGAQITGPIVLLNCTFKGNGHIEGHQRWSTGFLMDNCILPEGGLDFKNRGSMGSGHGWGTAWAVAWNCVAKTFVNQLPPGTANWCIGCIGKRELLPRPFDKTGLLPEGYYDSHGTHVAPQSLYLAQLRDRLGPAALTAIGY